MAKYGVMMLEKLILRYSPRDGSSAGMRMYVSSMLPAFKLENPGLRVQEIADRSHRTPKAIAQYRSGQSKPVDLKNLSAKAIQTHISWLRSSHGRTQEYQVTRSRHLSRNPSIQGMWSVDTFAAQLERQNARRQAGGQR